MEGEALFPFFFNFLNSNQITRSTSNAYQEAILGYANISGRQEHACSQYNIKTKCPKSNDPHVTLSRGHP